MPTNDTNYSCYIKAVELIIRDLYHATSLIVASRVDTCIQTFVDRSNFKKPGVRWARPVGAWFNKSPYNIYDTTYIWMHTHIYI